MPRKQTVPDEYVLDAALAQVRFGGPRSLTFASVADRSGLAASTVVQRFGTISRLLRATLLRAWDLLDSATADAVRAAGPGPSGAVDLLARLTARHDGPAYADGLLVLREDLRDPVLRERGRVWLHALAAAVDERVPGSGALAVAHWQGTLTVWGFTGTEPLVDDVRAALTDLLRRLGS